MPHKTKKGPVAVRPPGDCYNVGKCNAVAAAQPKAWLKCSRQHDFINSRLRLRRDVPCGDNRSKHAGFGEGCNARIVIAECLA